MNLPDVHQAILDEATLRDLYVDIEQFTTNVSASFKSGPKDMTANEMHSIATAREAMLSGQVASCQIRYDFEGDTWCDTITRRDNGYSLVRISMSAASTLST